jgi:hypothetical protein
MVDRRAILVIAALALAFLAAAPVTATESETVCGVLVCARAEAGVRWECGRLAPSSTVVECAVAVFATGEGSSDLVPPVGLGIPASAIWRTILRCVVATPDGLEGCGSENEGPNRCTFDGLGENRCGGTSFDDYGPYVFTLAPGECIHDALADAERDVLVTADAWASASRSAPVVGVVDETEASARETIALSSLPRDETTCVTE